MEIKNGKKRAGRRF